MERNPQMKKLKICVSACLLGFKYRYDGTSDFFTELVEQLKDKADFIPVCPEVECGLPIPRDKMHLKTSSRGTRLVKAETDEDMTGLLDRWLGVKLEQLAERKPDGFLLHSRSPCCGLESTKLYNPEGRLFPRKTSGLFAAAVRRRFPSLPVGDETDLASFLEKLGLRKNRGSK